ncbi:MAG: ABC transporter ATP-binding protein [Pseudomonadota bacterium]
MSVSHRYRNFGGSQGAVNGDLDTSSEALEDQKLQAFEAGYQAGWDDATKAKAEEKEKLTAEFGQNLLDMSFTYQEALSKLTLSLEPTMRQIIDKLLPEIVRAALGAHVFEQVQQLLKTQVGKPVEIVVNPKNVETVKTIVGSKLPDPFKIVGEDSLGEGQAFVRIGDDERQVDLDSLVSDVSKAMTAFFHESGKEQNDG